MEKSSFCMPQSHRGEKHLQVCSYYPWLQDGDYFSRSCYGHFTPKERRPLHIDRGWVGPTAGLHAFMEKKIPCSAGNRTPKSQVYSRNIYFSKPNIRRAQVKVGLRLERPYSQPQNFAISPVDGSVCQEKFGIHSITAVCC